MAYLRRLAKPERFLIGDNNGSFGTLSPSGDWTPTAWLTTALLRPGGERAEDFDVDPTAHRLAYRESVDGTVWCVEAGGVRRALLFGGRVRRLGNYIMGERRQAYDSGMSWSTDGKRLALSVPSRRILYEAAGDHDADTFVLHVPTGRVRRCGPGVPLGWLDATRVLTYRHRKKAAEVRDATTGRLLRSVPCRTAHPGRGILVVERSRAGFPARMEALAFPGFRPLGSISMEGRLSEGTSIVAVWRE